MMFFHHAKEVTYCPHRKLSEGSWSASIKIDNGVETVIHLHFADQVAALNFDAAMIEASICSEDSPVGYISMSFHRVKTVHVPTVSGFEFGLSMDDQRGEVIRVFMA